MAGRELVLEPARIGGIRDDEDPELDRHAAIIAWTPAQPIPRLTPGSVRRGSPSVAAPDVLDLNR
jgi:hypothetical protein